MNAEKSLRNLELTKLFGIWRSKGFEKPVSHEPRITRPDCSVYFARKKWIIIDDSGNKIATCDTLRGALNRTH
ncbi:hypothetical protein [Nissabacter sp. SGAir0207]|uniref:hypothetical protein n=1 Tax=Nissabacter sp. SGAir0207 TaxID=2126321 RepID=UPI0010CCFF1D|nr:hypothetical protein [Nissabacter sp. SGAir0207]QCR38709.1 hypothetical protein C1N62_21460 [Nissabacter sp. SGAir0207]